MKKTYSFPWEYCEKLITELIGYYSAQFSSLVLVKTRSNTSETSGVKYLYSDQKRWQNRSVWSWNYNEQVWYELSSRLRQ